MHFVFNEFLIFFKYRAIYQIMGKNNIEHCRSQMTIWHMRIECWTPMSTRTHAEYVMIIAFRLQQWLQERASKLRYSYFACIAVGYK